MKRLEEKEKNWKFSAADLKERALWDKYEDAYERMIRHTATEHAPWYVVPADHKWFTRLAVAEAIVETLRSLDLAYPKVSAEQRKTLAAVREGLIQEKE